MPPAACTTWARDIPSSRRASNAIEDQLHGAAPVRLAAAPRGAARQRSSNWPACIRATTSSASARSRPPKGSRTSIRTPGHVPGHARGRIARRRRQRAGDGPGDVGRVRACVLQRAPARSPRRARHGDGLLLLQQRRGRRRATRSTAHGLERVAILDFDVHLGNGTEDIFKDDERVLLCSSYQYPLYPDMNPPTRAGAHRQLPAAAGQRQRRVPRGRAPSTGCRPSRHFAPQLLLHLGGLRRARRRPAWRELSAHDAPTTPGSPRWPAASRTRMRRDASSRRSKAVTTCTALATSAAAHIERLMAD